MKIGLLVVNGDDENCLKLKEYTKAKAQSTKTSS